MGGDRLLVGMSHIDPGEARQLQGVEQARQILHAHAVGGEIEQAVDQPQPLRITLAFMQHGRQRRLDVASDKAGEVAGLGQVRRIQKAERAPPRARPGRQGEGVRN